MSEPAVPCCEIARSGECLLAQHLPDESDGPRTDIFSSRVRCGDFANDEVHLDYDGKQDGGCSEDAIESERWLVDSYESAMMTSMAYCGRKISKAFGSMFDR